MAENTHAHIVEPPLPPPRYSFGGDEFVYCEISEEMSFHANFKGLAICQELQRRELPGVIEICPSNASYQVRVDPDVFDPHDVLALLEELYASVDAEHLHFRTRVIDVPAYYNDPWTREVLMNFRDRHQNPTGTDLEYVARVNGFATEEEFIEAHHRSPYYVSMVGFVPGLPWCFQMVPRERMLEVPKYIRPRTDTPALALSHGGAFAAIYPVRGPGGYQLFAICPVPIFDPTQELPDFEDSFVVFRTGDIIKLRPIDREEYDAIREQVDARTYRYRMADVDFEPAAFFEDPDGYNERLLKELYG